MATPKKPATKSGASAKAKKAADKPQSQSDMAKALLEKVKAQSKGGAPGAPGQKPGFDPNAMRGGKGGMGGAHNQMMRRTQGKGGGGGGGGGGGNV